MLEQKRASRVLNEDKSPGAGHHDDEDEDDIEEYIAR